MKIILTKEEKIMRNHQFLLLFICFLVYSFAQLGRYSYMSNINSIMAEYNINHTTASLPSTIFFLCYGGGQIVNGIFCKKYNIKYVLIVSLIISSICNILLFVKIPFSLVKYIWGVNGLAQSFLWVLLMQMVGKKISDKYMSIATLVMSFASAGGTFISYGVFALFSGLNIYIYSFLCSAILMTTMSLVWFFFNKKSAQDIDEKNTEKEIAKGKTFNEPKKGFFVLLILFAFLSLTSYLISGSLKSWAPNIFAEVYGTIDWLSIFLSLFLPFCTIFCAYVNQVLYKKLKDFNVISWLSFIACIIFTVLMILFINTHWLVGIVLLVCICFSSGLVTNALTVQVPLFLQNKKVSSGMLAGILNGTCYLGNALGTFILGVIVDKSSWKSVFYFFIAVAGISLILSLTYTIVSKIKKQA